MPLYFDPADMPTPGSVVTFSRRDEETGIAADLQQFTLLTVTPHTTKAGEASAIVLWKSGCMDCDTRYTFTTGPDTGSFYRRCKKCRRGKRFTGWPKGPRIQHRITLGELAPEAVKREIAGSEEGAWPLFSALTSADRMAWMRAVKTEMGNGATFDVVRDRIERLLQTGAQLDIDPASLF